MNSSSVPLSDFEGRRRAFRLIEASRGSLFVVTMDDDDDPKSACLYTESPEEQALTDKEPQFFLIRVFTNQHEADNYRQAVATSYTNLKPSIIEFENFEALYPALKDADGVYRRTLGLPVRAVLSDMPSESWPKTIETVFPPPAFPA